MPFTSDFSPTASFFLYSSAAFSTLTVLYYGYHRYRGGNKCPPDRLDGLVVVLTGATSGIGKATAEELVQRGAVVVLACRDLASANKLALDLTSQAVKHNDVGRATAMLLDLSSLDSIRNFIDLFKEDFTKIDILINNAGILGGTKQIITHKDGHEEHFQVNHLSPLALTLLALPLLRKSEDARIIFLSAGAVRKGILNFENLESEKLYDPLTAYANSKLCQLLCAQELSRRLENSTVSSNHHNHLGIFIVNPGIVSTNLTRNYVQNPVGKFFVSLTQNFFFKTPNQGAQNVLYCVINKKLRGESGKFYENCRESQLKMEISRDRAAAKRLWDVSLQKIGLANLKL